MNLNFSHPKIQTFWSCLEILSGGIPKVYVCLGSRLKGLAIKHMSLGQGQSLMYTQTSGEEGDAEYSAAT